jgi:hypothetical protein
MFSHQADEEMTEFTAQIHAGQRNRPLDSTDYDASDTSDSDTNEYRYRYVDYMTPKLLQKVPHGIGTKK